MACLWEQTIFGVGWSLLSTQSGLDGTLGSSRFSEKSCLKRIKWRRAEEVARHQCLASTHVSVFPLQNCRRPVFKGPQQGHTCFCLMNSNMQTVGDGMMYHACSLVSLCAPDQWPPILELWHWTDKHNPKSFTKQTQDKTRSGKRITCSTTWPKQLPTLFFKRVSSPVTYPPLDGPLSPLSLWGCQALGGL